MKTIWKYKLEVTDDVNIEMPVGAEILTVQTQKKIPMIWALVDSNNDKEIRYFEIIGTGNPIEEVPEEIYIRKYINTFQLYDGSLVFHLFEKIF